MHKKDIIIPGFSAYSIPGGDSMKFTRKQWHVTACLFTAAAGVLLHFTYDLTGNAVSALFGSVNESAWEHLKLAFWPAILMTVAEYMCYGYGEPSFIQSRCAGILTMLSIPLLLSPALVFLFGRRIVAADILIFFLAVAAGFAVSYRLMQKKALLSPLWAAAAILILTALGLMFVCFTFAPPELSLFRDPITKTYGIGKPSP